MATAAGSLVVRARRYETGEPVQITIRGERIERVEPAWPATPVDDWPWVAPGLFDLQVNGHGGVWFADRQVTAGQAAGAIRAYLPHGVAQICPTLITSSYETLAAGFQAIAQACDADAVVDAMVAGCHLEGPYLSPVDGPRGAHPREHIRPADWNEFSRLQELSRHRIRLVTIAPEVDGALEFIRHAVTSGVTISLGHTAANTDQIAAAVDAGAKLSTHLGNGAHPQIRRHPNYIWDQLGDSRLMASLITDGHHLPPSVVRSMVRSKGVQNTIITCDASGWAGCRPGRYKTDLGEVDVLADGRIVVAGQEQILAGSGAATDECVTRAVEFGAATLREAIDMACRNPARLLGFREYRLMAGDAAHLVVYRSGQPQTVCATRPQFDVVATVVAGRLAWGALPAL